MADAERDPERQLVTQLDVKLAPDPSRTVIRPFEPNDPDGYADPKHPRTERIIAPHPRLVGRGVRPRAGEDLGIARREASRRPRDAAAPVRGGVALYPRSRATRRRSSHPDRRLSVGRIRLRSGGAVQPQHRRQSGPVRRRRGRHRLHPFAARDRRRAFVVGRVPHWRMAGRRHGPARSAERDSGAADHHQAGGLARRRHHSARLPGQPRAVGDGAVPDRAEPEPRHRGTCA